MADPLPALAAGGKGSTRIEELPSILPDDADSLGYRKITLGPHETRTYFAALSFIKSATNSIKPSLTRDTLVKEGIILTHKNKTKIDVITNLFAGIMLMMIFYALSEYVQTRKPEFLYYVGYSVCISVLLFLKSTMNGVTTSFNYFFESFSIISFFGSVIYAISFFIVSSWIRKKIPEPGPVSFLGVHCHYYPDGPVHPLLLPVSPISGSPIPSRDSTKILLLVISLVFVIKGLTYRNQLMNYIVMGNISLCLLSIISQLMITTNFKVVKGIPSVLNLALFYYEAGITIELLFFLFALTYKNKMEIILSIQKEEKLKLETERKELEKQVAVLAAKQDERNRISVDMHDELGSGVTAIRLMSEIVKSK